MERRTGQPPSLSPASGFTRVPRLCSSPTSDESVLGGWIPAIRPPPRSFSSLGDSPARLRRKGVSPDDVLSVLFDSEAAPTFGQAENLYTSAVKNLCPECEFAFGVNDYQYARPITFRNDPERRLGRPLTAIDALTIRCGQASWPRR